MEAKQLHEHEQAVTVSKINVPKVQTSIYLGYINTAKLNAVLTKFEHI